MCGIAGLFTPDGRPDTDALESMSSRLIHRGPDDSGLYLDGPVGLAHRRLSIIDLETGRQPIFNETGDVAVVFNGEIYNYERLRRSLSDAGHVFSTDTDTEVLVHSYEEEGISFVEQLEGMFSFALWDGKKERLVLARDRLGIKPLVFARDGDRLAFSSELPAILESGVPHGGVNREALARYFALGHVSAPRTAFQNVEKLRPGEMVVAGEGSFDRRKYYRVVPDRRAPSVDRAARELRNRVTNSVEQRLQSDVPLGAFLSGGIDSSIIVGAMSQLTEEPIQTFTVGFTESTYDESWAAREVAEYHDTDHHEFEMRPSDLRRMIPEVLPRLGEPFADPSLLPTFAVSQATSDEVKVALSGDGADELFAGYDRYRAEYLSKYYRALPRSVRRKAVEPVIDLLPATRENRVGTALYQAQWVASRASTSNPVSRHSNWLRAPEGRAIDGVAGRDLTVVAQHEMVEAYTEYFAAEGPDDVFTRMQTIDVARSLPDQILHKVDLASMYNSLEVRVPFLDHRVVEYALGLPTRQKITARRRKRILKRAFGDLLPQSILERDKQGFDMPIGTWLRRDFADDFRDAVRGPSIGLLDSDVVMEVFEEHAAKRRNHAKFLWSVYVYKKWLARMQRQNVLDGELVTV